ncbi:MAG: tripartite tricarboxylate transporter substrate binding protein [Polaromonas sp.]|nr:tripartite tricarboxylate transporter substrate binding protein [Polaromonas sp.]
MRVVTLLRLAMALSIGAALGAQAQSGYPVKPIHLIVAYAPGGAVDSVARKLALSLGESLGQQIVVENRPGASGNIGSDYVAKSAGDGYTLLFAPSTLIANPMVTKSKPPFDLKTDLAAITMVASGPLLMVVNPAGPTSVKDFVARARANPEKFNFGTGGYGAAGHLSAEYFKLRAGVKDVPVILYKGTAPALTDIIGGTLSAMMEPTLSAMQQVRGGKLRALAITGAKRDPLFPDVPTFAEAGFQGMEFSTWYGVWGPASMPFGLQRRLAEASKTVLDSADFRSWLAERGYEPSPISGAAFAVFLDNESKRYARIVRDGHIQPE